MNALSTGGTFVHSAESGHDGCVNYNWLPYTVTQDLTITNDWVWTLPCACFVTGNDNAGNTWTAYFAEGFRDV